ncbi:unnamed protein product [Zymoseptoria tritici ST99CH_1A5]|uniref:Peptidase A1 domain-containing protein n=4 Tax=Zymoseptoria tritici TaxID=1047171 RepID=F9XQ33_ZYMTI|nr:uncharacterized protein MYCGRDRAFT_77835 [Zymoseptoria tritici IPO323]SMQ56191.1 unnamed protein product [Zymoseptoria tritici ST99CH_3D7]SMR62026.1 unnamed protein product [Zymoseptoria tritici ST99CH_1E4]SMR64524.1 unnamed protein product [Zymoseptoria tritici ST99CH_3D1]SMY29865.1 unnamed protein product [Zymoseptoria tritici ST99CH_1A5]EGP82725.1 hypothetical protein MYCGRDRAFT_77835 [Zymoseptoria tritici IPO323]
MLFVHQALSALTLLATFVSGAPSAGLLGLGVGAAVDVDLNIQLLAELGVAITENVTPLTPLADFNLDASLDIRIFFGRGGYGTLQNVAHGARYTITIDIDGEPYPVQFDTGSGDLWLPRANFTCEDGNYTVTDPSNCIFAGRGPTGFSQGTIDDEIYDISYSDKSAINGTFGYGTVSYGGITVQKQQYALADRGYFPGGNNFTSGIMGFGLPSLTEAYYTDGTRNNYSTVPYNSWPFQAIEDGLLAPSQFTVGLFRRGLNDTQNSYGGFVALGGTPPPADFPYTGVWATTPMIKVAYPTFDIPLQYDFYNLQPDGFTVNGNFFEWVSPIQNDTGLQAPTIVDSGTTVSRVPSYVSAAIAQAFEPPAHIDHDFFDWYIAPCNSTVPEVSFRLGGKDFAITPRDILIDGELGEVYSDQSCLMGFQPNPDPSKSNNPSYAANPIFGMTFMRNVVVVHDLENYQLTFGGVLWD